ncbi:unnamed protein product [Fraxinus pennsylvanica]|uniref:Scarecrow-like protein 23 n=1 Tax=Fraxinus pennsylvanica TaxID=56036 RepID=A0AAD2A710_9LAMI|nr:unnamed protein product [Fraxinus pennsylvanica]
MHHSSTIPLTPHNKRPNKSSSSSSMNYGKCATVDLPSAATDLVKHCRSQAMDPSISDEKEHESEKEQLKAHVIEEGDSIGHRLLGLLLQCAECVAMDNLDDAGQLLPEIAELSSPFGSLAQFIGVSFADTPSSRIISSYLGIYSSLTILYNTYQQKLLNALQIYNSVSPLIKFLHFTANQAFQEALDGIDHVHFIDLNIMQGLQWSGLFHILASKS